MVTWVTFALLVDHCICDFQCNLKKWYSSLLLHREYDIRALWSTSACSDNNCTTIPIPINNNLSVAGICVNVVEDEEYSNKEQSSQQIKATPPSARSLQALVQNISEGLSAL